MVSKIIETIDLKPMLLHHDHGRILCKFKTYFMRILVHRGRIRCRSITRENNHFIDLILMFILFFIRIHTYSRII